MDEIERFLRALYGSKPEDLYILLWDFPRKKSAWFRDCGKAAQYARELGETNIYCGVNLSPKSYGPDKRCKTNDIAGLVALVCDIDCAGEAHSKKALPATIEEAEALLPPGLPPSMLVHSGHGIQAWWILKAPWIFQDAMEREQAQDLAKRWDRFLKDRAAVRGFSADSVFDLARILRVAGTTNTKHPPAPVKLASIIDARYEVAEIVAFLDAQTPRREAPLRPPRMVETARSERSATVAPRQSGGIVYSPNAEMNPEILAALLENDERFRASWEGQRTDFTDRSQSSYDLAIANTLRDAGVSRQEVANAIVQNRRIHSAPAKVDPLDYLRRTIAKADERIGAADAESAEPVEEAGATENEKTADAAVKNGATGATAPTGLVNGAAVATAAAKKKREPKPKPEMQAPPADKAAALAAVNTAIAMRIEGVRVDVVRAVRIPAGREATWTLELSTGQLIYLEHEKEYSNYIAFASQCRTQVNGIIAVPKKDEWYFKVVPCMQQCWAADAEEQDIRDETRSILDGYLAARGVWTREHVFETPNRDGVPFLYARQNDAMERIAVSTKDILAWLARERAGEKHTEKALNSGLNAIGADRTAVHRDRRTTQSRYLLGPEWKAADYRAAHNRTLQMDEPTEEKESTWAN